MTDKDDVLTPDEAARAIKFKVWKAIVERLVLRLYRRRHNQEWY